MNLQRHLAALAAASLASSALALAEDVRVTCTGTVSSFENGGVATAPFAGAAVGDAVTLVVDVELANQLPFNLVLGALNWPSSSLAVGANTDGLAFTSGQTVHLGNDAVWYGDYVSLASTLATDTTTQFQVFLSDASGQTWNTRDWAALIGTSVQATGFVSTFRIWSPQGAVNIDLDTVTFAAAPGAALGALYCTAAPNSSGSTGLLSAFGSDTPADNDLTLVASQLPNQSVGYFLVSATQGFVANAGGSMGNLCLSGEVGRFSAPGQIKATDFGGEIALPIDLGHLPTPVGAVAVQAGQTWNFQLWHRDNDPAGPTTSNFTRALSVTFQ